MTSTRRELSELFSTIPLFLTGIFLFALPLLFTSQMSEAFMLPKHIFLTAIVTVGMVSLILRTISEGKLKIRTTPFDVPVIIFTIVVILSAFLSVNKFDSLIAAMPFMYAALLFMTIVNSVKSEKALLYILSCLILGASVTSVITILAFFKVYPLPFDYAQNSNFTPIGSFLDQAIYLALVLPVTGYFAMRFVTVTTRKSMFSDAPKIELQDILFTIAFLLITAGLLISAFYLLTSNKPFLLPFGNGFQIAFAAISQDAGRLIKSFLFGSGYGTFLTDFTRFKQPAYNSDSTLWSVTFLRSSSFVLELLATTGMLGVLSYLFIVFKVIREKTLFLPIVVAIIASFLIPFSPLLVTVFFAFLGIFSVVRMFSGAKGFSETELHLVGFYGNAVENTPSSAYIRRQGILIAGILMLIIIASVGIADYFLIRFTLSDMAFQRSLVAAAQNKGSETYKLQSDAIKTFPYRDVYHRVFSQTNLSLANALARQTPQGSSPSAQVQQNILTLIQQSINTGRSAASISPYSAVNWNNLSGIYRSLIGFGQNADQFAVLTNQQAVSLDPSNPAQYVNLGGIYYQLGLWDEAIRQFQIAIRLKPDYANAYYNAGHTLEAKGNLTQALTVYQAVKTLVAKNPDASKKISVEIDTLQKKIADKTVVAGASTPNEETEEAKASTTKQTELNVNKPQTILPTQNPKQPIAGPSISPLPSPTGSKSTSPTPTPEEN